MGNQDTSHLSVLSFTEGSAYSCPLSPELFFCKAEQLQQQGVRVPEPLKNLHQGDKSIFLDIRGSSAHPFSQRRV